MSFSRNVAIYGSADILGAGIGLLASPITTRLLSQEQYGALPILTAVWAVVALVQYAGMDFAYPFFRSRKDVSSKSVLVTATYLATISCLVVCSLFFAANMTLTSLGQFARVSQFELALFLLGVAPSSLLNWYLFILRYEDQAMAFARVSLIGRTVGVLAALPVMSIVDQEHRLIVLFAAGTMVSVLAVLWALSEFKRLSLNAYQKWEFSRAVAYPLLRYGLVLVPGAVVYALITVVDRLLVGWYIGPDGNAVLALAASIGGAVLLIKLWFARAWDPKMVDWLRSGDRNLYIPRLQLGINLIAFGMLPLPLMAAIWTDVVITFLYPPEYSITASLIPIIVSAGVVSCFSLVAVATAMIRQTSKLHLPIYSLALLINVFVGIILLPRLGVSGVLFGTLAAEFGILLTWIIFGKFVYKNLDLKWLLAVVGLCICTIASIMYYPGIFISDNIFLERVICSALILFLLCVSWVAFDPLLSWKSIRSAG